MRNRLDANFLIEVYRKPFFLKHYKVGDSNPHCEYIIILLGLNFYIYFRPINGDPVPPVFLKK